MNIQDLIGSKKIRWTMAIVASMIFVFFILRPKPKSVETHIVQEGVYRQILREEGITQVQERFVIFSPVNGVLRRVTKNVGESVQKGDVLANVDWDTNRTIRSPINGVVLKIFRESEGPIMMQERIMEVGDITKLEIKSDILTDDVIELDKGDEVWITGFKDETITGKVRLVEPSAFTKVSSLGVEEQRVNVWTEIPEVSGLGDGFRLGMSFILFEVPNSIVIPSSALFREGSEWYVYTVQKNRAVKRPVKIPYQSQGTALVESGLSKGEMIILYPGDAIADGSKVSNN